MGWIMNDYTLLWRQVHPSWVQKGRVSSQLFKPTQKDEGKLSVNDGDQVTAEASWTRYTGGGFESAGVVSVSHSECNGLYVPVVLDGRPDPDHAFLDFRPFSRSKINQVADLLSAFARSRGWCYGPV